MNKRKKNNIIIGMLLGIVLLMAVGYAAFSSVLNIQGTGAITTSWNIKITNIETILPSEIGDSDIHNGYNISEPTYTPTSATFNAGFELPGSMIAYIVEITNYGSIIGQVTIGNLSCGDNPAISCQVMAMDKNPLKDMPNNYFDFDYGNQDYSDIEFSIRPSEKHYIMVAVGFADVTTMPDDLDASIQLDLTYEQYVNPNITGETVLVGNQQVDVMKNGDGLYADEYEAGRYVYKGADPNNYIKFNEELWRIVSKEADGTYKIILNELINSNYMWDRYSNNWSTPSYLNNYLNSDYYNEIGNSWKSYVVSYNWFIGVVESNNNDLINQIADENSIMWSGTVGLISVSDYLRSNTNTAQCGTFYLNNTNYNTCANTTWLIGSRTYWLISAVKNTTNYVWRVLQDGNISSNEVSYTPSPSYIRPSLYLSSEITLTGKGTLKNPYVIEPN